MRQNRIISLKEYNTFHINVSALYSFFCETEQDIFEILNTEIVKEKNILVLGGGSNMLFTQDVDDVVIFMQNKGIEIISETAENVFVKVSAGEIWDEFVEYCVSNNFGGTENLSLIPGTAGASPVQNIGAYGVEVKDIIFETEAIEILTGKKRIFKNKECNFAYRNSIFKQELKNQYIVLNVTFCLSKFPVLKLSYGNLISEIINKNPTIKDVRDAVIRIRESKLPNPDILPNAGSFFKNPIISDVHFTKLIKQFPQLVSYPAGDGKIKLAAGQLIDLCGWKGKTENGVGVHNKQALVIINYNNAAGKSILQFSEKIQNSVFKKFGVNIEREVRVYP
ncbi:MAG: UDP-N-acetylmuramate dehydrogenase [Bacteroidales bacterium]|nr:UDP-N-acetylmuramate dehydrogenase [Bacteroidales bacterium]